MSGSSSPPATPEPFSETQEGIFRTFALALATGDKPTDPDLYKTRDVLYVFQLLSLGNASALEFLGSALNDVVGLLHLQPLKLMWIGPDLLPRDALSLVSGFAVCHRDNTLARCVCFGPFPDNPVSVSTPTSPEPA
jgi:hypothetical protein